MYQKTLAEEKVAGNLEELDCGLARETQSWADFLRVEISPKSVFELKNWSITPQSFSSQFGSFTDGRRTVLEDAYEESISPSHFPPFPIIS